MADATVGLATPATTASSTTRVAAEADSRARAQGMEDVTKIGITEHAHTHYLKGPGYLFFKEKPDPRHLAGEEYIVQVSFEQLDPSPIGLIMDWSMALPVIAGILPGRPASQHANLTPGLVLLAVNNRGLLAGRPRSETEELLAARPLNLVFESAAAGRFGEVWQQPWQCTGPADCPPSKETVMFSTGRKWPIKPQLVKELRGEIQPSDSAPTKSAFLCRSTGQNFFKDNPERSPLQRYGALDIAPPLADTSLALTAGSMRRSRKASKPRSTGSDKLPLIGLGHTRSEPGPLNMSSASNQAGRQPSTVGATRASFRSGGYAGEGGQARKIDPCYQLLVNCYAEEAQGGAPIDGAVARSARRGAGRTANWPLDHDDGYTCTMADMRLAHRMRDAYEVGFVGYKLNKPTQMHILMYKAAPPRIKTVVNLDEDPVWCDLCGDDVATTEQPGRFWFCRRCKRNGHRYDLCMACHAVEVLQGEGKHAGSGPHPHYLRHEHSDIYMQPNLRIAYPYSPHIRRVFCDHCGGLINFRNEDTVVYMCPRCPEEHGLRFELCATCAISLRDNGNGLRYTLAAAGL